MVLMQNCDAPGQSKLIVLTFLVLNVLMGEISLKGKLLNILMILKSFEIGGLSTLGKSKIWTSDS